MAEFSFYDSEGHLVSLSSGLIESGVSVYFDAAIWQFDRSRSIDVVKIGPIMQWYDSSFILLLQ